MLCRYAYPFPVIPQVSVGGAIGCSRDKLEVLIDETGYISYTGDGAVSFT